MIKKLPSILLTSIALSACGGETSSTGSAANTQPACAETGSDPQYACKTGSTEPLYQYQWALNQAKSFFAKFGLVANGKTDINVESAHAAGIKGKNVKVLVLDDGLDIRHEDLAPNVDTAMTYNFETGASDPTPTGADDAHGTHVAGIIAAAQNGKGVIGVAPRATLGGARFLVENADSVQAYGGADWSKTADILNASYGVSPPTPLEYDTTTSTQASIRAFPALRRGKGLVMLKAAGNSFVSVDEVGAPSRICPQIANSQGLISCDNSANDPEALEPGVVVVAAANAQGVKSSYSSAGAVNWITGLGGEYGEAGAYGEVGSGPAILSTDLSGCSRGYSRYGMVASNAFDTAGTAINLKENPGCNYSSMNGTSAATPVVSGVVALMLAANPNLTWRDVREILRATARKIDPNYGTRDGRNVQIDLSSGAATNNTSNRLIDGATTARLDYGWQRNGAGHDYSTWYGFGLVDAGAAVKMARSYTAYKSGTLTIPNFTPAFGDVAQIRYGSVQKLGQFNVAGGDVVDALQLRLTGSICVGSVGIFVKSPSGTVSALALPYNIFYASNVPSASNYGLASYAFHGEKAAGNWEVYAVNAVPSEQCTSYTGKNTALATPLSVEYRMIAAR